ncbi:ZBED1-like protein [Mya arenaria]|uniref:ZBED1-like protein n=1 Tax=Mya arenaria TaxID=6604 RepID=A0ABY7GED8_MYAAR|nr:ZBED1-like protein [Mya arenaria]
MAAPDSPTSAASEELLPELFAYPGGKTKSIAWKYFKFRKQENGDLELRKAVCVVCGKEYANKGNTTNLLSHLNLEHKHLMVVPPTDKTQPRIASIFKQTAVAGGGKLSKEKEERYTIPSKKSVVKSLEGKMEEMKKKIIKDVAGQQVSLTHDGWTSISTQSFDTVTCHMINDDWELKSAVLQTKKIEGQHTSENIAANLKQTIECWGLTPAVITTDNAANEKKAVSLLGLTRFGCFGHRLNLAVKKSLQLPLVSELLKKGRHLVTFFHKSSSASDLMMKKQKIVFSSSPQLIGHRLIMDCPTRWNSTQEMIRRLLEQMPVLMNVASDHDNQSISKSAISTIKANVYTFEEQGILQDIVRILENFNKATKVLCAENSPSIQNVCAVTKKLTMCISSTVDENETVQSLKEVLLSELEKRTEYEDIPLLGAVLNPDTKGLTFLTNEEKDRTLSLLKNKAYDMSVMVKKEKNDPDAATAGQEANIPELPNLPELPNVPPVPDNDGQELSIEDEPASKKAKVMCSDYMDWLSDVIVVGESSVPVVDLVQEELNRYLLSERRATDSKLTLLQWWKENEFQFPRLAKIAKSVLAVPASSVPSERVFSLAGNIVSKKRARMKPELVDMLIFLKMNRKLYW